MNLREEMLREAWRKSLDSFPTACLTLESLVSAMRQGSGKDPRLTSLYFAGADVDHPYFLKTDALAIGIAVLPEDAEKARKPKRHPHQTEVIFVLEGSLTLHRVGERDRVLAKHEHFVIEQDVCHWVTPVAGQKAVFVFVKTNPAQEPRGVDCGPIAP